jgi:hypothetical protein
MAEDAEAVRAAVLAVLETARAWRAGPGDSVTEAGGLVMAVDALDAVLTPKTTGIEGPMPWRKVLAGDLALGADGNWHRILGVHGGPDGQVAVDIEVQGRPRRYPKDGDTEVRIRREFSAEATALAVLEQAGLDLSTVLSKGA